LLVFPFIDPIQGAFDVINNFLEIRGPRFGELLMKQSTHLSAVHVVFHKEITSIACLLMA
jgi:hypothetical protein